MAGAWCSALPLDLQVRYLACDPSALLITGQVYAIDGGMSMH